MATACTHCGLGTLARAAGAEACEVCGAGRYVEAPGDTRCTQCPKRGVRCSNGKLALLKGWWYPPLRASADTARSNASAVADPGIDTADARGVDASTEMRKCALSGLACEYGAERRVVRCAPTFEGAFFSSFCVSHAHVRYSRPGEGVHIDLHCSVLTLDSAPLEQTQQTTNNKQQTTMFRSALRRVRERCAPRRRVRAVRRRKL